MRSWVRTPQASPCCVLEQGTSTPYSTGVLVKPRKRWLRPDMTEKLLTGTLSLNTNKQTDLCYRYVIPRNFHHAVAIIKSYILWRMQQIFYINNTDATRNTQTLGGKLMKSSEILSHSATTMIILFYTDLSYRLKNTLRGTCVGMVVTLLFDRVKHELFWACANIHKSLRARGEEMTGCACLVVPVMYLFALLLNIQTLIWKCEKKS